MVKKILERLQGELAERIENGKEKARITVIFSSFGLASAKAHKDSFRAFDFTRQTPDKVFGIKWEVDSGQQEDYRIEEI